MKKRNVWAVYFSATGTTRRIALQLAGTLAECLDVPAKQFDFTLPDARKEAQIFSDSDLVVFAVPVYAGRVPNVLLSYLRTLQGNGALAVPVVLYGNRNYDDALIELRDLLEADGFHTLAAGAFIGEHSFSTVLAGGRPDEQDLAAAQKLAGKIREKLEKDDLPVSPIPVKGETPIRGYYQPRDRQGNPVDIRKVTPKTNGDCDDCKLCARVCPMGSISFEDVRTLTGICIKCGACIKKCPRHAKYYDSESYLYHQHELEEGFSRRAEPELFY